MESWLQLYAMIGLPWLSFWGGTSWVVTECSQCFFGAKDYRILSLVLSISDMPLIVDPNYLCRQEMVVYLR